MDNIRTILECKIKEYILEEFRKSNTNKIERAALEKTLKKRGLKKRPSARDNPMFLETDIYDYGTMDSH